MRIYLYELKKLVSSVTVWAFMVGCLLFNLVLIINSDDDYADFVNAVSENTGYILDKSFYESLSQITTSDEQYSYYLEQLKQETYGATDIFDGYDTKYIGEKYINAAGLTGYFAKAMRNKYLALQKVVNKKAEEDESLTLYFAGATYFRHQFLFHTLMGWLFTEGALLAVLLALLSTGYENIYQTENIVYSTKKGRWVLKTKLAASVSAGLGAYVLLALLTFFVYFGINKYDNIWNSSISSLFNYRKDLIAGIRPFVTWHSVSVLSYFFAMLALGAGLILCFCQMAYGIGLIVRNSYMAFLVFLLANAISIAIPVQIPQSSQLGYAIKYLFVLSPVGLWLKHGLWFTDGDIEVIWPCFETLGLCVSFVALTVFCLFTVIFFRKRDLT